MFSEHYALGTVNEAGSLRIKTVQRNFSRISPDKAENQRRIISEALRWGINNKRITIEEIKDVSPQETVDIAQKIIKNMSE